MVLPSSTSGKSSLLVAQAKGLGAILDSFLLLTSYTNSFRKCYWLHLQNKYYGVTILIQAIILFTVVSHLISLPHLCYGLFSPRGQTYPVKMQDHIASLLTTHQWSPSHSQ